LALFKPLATTRRALPPPRRAAAGRHAGAPLTPAELHALRRSAPLK
jgi:hypothetical protein